MSQFGSLSITRRCMALHRHDGGIMRSGMICVLESGYSEFSVLVKDIAIV